MDTTRNQLSHGGGDPSGDAAPPRTRGRLDWPESLLTDIDAQRRIVARIQLLTAFGEHVVDDLVRANAFERLERGVYRAVGGPVAEPFGPSVRSMR